jgi:predicted ATPase/transcriptional regulator with XRE-family HTH domain
MSAEDHDLATLLRRHRTSAGLTQEELAEQAGISTRTISDVERGLRSSVYRDTASRIAGALGLDEDQRTEFRAAARGPKRRTPQEDAETSVPAEVRSGTIPVHLTPLIGREKELDSVLAALRGPAIRLVTITGAGGIGKTRVAIEAATASESDFKDGVFFVSLGATRDASLVPSVVARTLGMAWAHEPLIDALAERLGDEQSLLVLDTFEQVLEAASFVGDLLGRCDGLRVMVTSREPLHLRGEHNIPLPTLQLPPDAARATAKDLEGYPATALFLDRARAVKPDLIIDAQGSTLIVEICQRLDGLPLAIELGAARVRHLPLWALRMHLDRRLHLLTGGPRDLPPRQQTMRDTVGWSYDLLPGHEQSFFRRLSVFAGGWTLDAAGSVSDSQSDDALTLTSALIDKSLVLVRDTGSEQPRYDMLDVIREYGEERLRDEGEDDASLRSHAQYFLALAEEAERHFGRAGQQEWFDRLAADHGNFEAALRWAIGRDHSSLALRLGGALWQYWRSHGDYSEGRMWLREALSIDAAADPELRAKALWGAAGLAYHHGDFDDAQRLSDELLPVARATGESMHLRNAWTIRGVVAMGRHRFADAVHPFREALAIAAQLGPSWLLGTSHLNLGSALLQAEDVDGARSNFIDAVGVYREVGDENFAARAVGQLGYVALLAGHEQEARSHFSAALEALRDLGDNWGIAEALEAFSALNASKGNNEAAARLAGGAERVRDTFGARALPADRVSVERYLETARESTDHRAWRSAWEEGRSMPLDRAIDLALTEGGG